MAYEDKCVYCGKLIFEKEKSIETEEGEVCGKSCYIKFQKCSGRKVNISKIINREEK